MSITYDEPLVHVGELFPFRPADERAAAGVSRPLGAALATPPRILPGDPAPTLGYSDESQVATVDGRPAVTSVHGEGLMAKKGNTVEDSQTDTEELAR